MTDKNTLQDEFLTHARTGTKTAPDESGLRPLDRPEISGVPADNARPNSEPSGGWKEAFRNFVRYWTEWLW